MFYAFALNRGSRFFSFRRKMLRFSVLFAWRSPRSIFFMDGLRAAEGNEPGCHFLGGESNLIIPTSRTREGNTSMVAQFDHRRKIGSFLVGSNTYMLEY